MSMRERILNLDLIRVLAMVMVVLMHTVINFTLRTDFFATKLWFLLEPAIALSRTAVLLFFMISGYLMVSKQRTIKENFEKTFKKLCLPLVFFTLIDSIINLSKFNLAVDGWMGFFSHEMNRLMNEKSSPLWFLVVLVFLYFLNPLWQKVFSQKDEGSLAKYLTKSALFFSILMAILEYPSGKIGMLFTAPTYWLGYVFFYLYGGLVKEKLVNFKNNRFNFFLLIGGLSLAIMGDFIAVYSQIKGINFIWNLYTSNYLSIPVIMMAIGLFNLLMNIEMKKVPSVILATLEKLAQLSFGVYLIHGYFILASRQIFGFKFDLVGMNVYLYNIIDVGSILILSMLATWIWLKIPKLKSLIGG